MRWKGKLIKHIIAELRNDSKWVNTIQKISNESNIGIHLAVFNEPFLSLVLRGEKKIESRFSINKISPFMKVSRGDIVVLKESGGLVTGVFLAGEVVYYQNITRPILTEIQSKYGNLICSAYDKDFWKHKDKANYASLIEVKKVKRLKPFKSEKSDRSGWSVLKENDTHPQLFGLT